MRGNNGRGAQLQIKPVLMWVLTNHRRTIRTVGRAKQCLQFLINHLLRKRVKRWREEQEQSGMALRWGEQTAYQRGIEPAVQNMVQDWTVNEVIAAQIGTAGAGHMSNITKARFKIKLFSQSLCTREEGWRLEEDKVNIGCRMGCKHSNGAGVRETNQHILWECTKIGSVCNKRRGILKDIRTELHGAGLGGQSLRAATLPWTLLRTNAAIRLNCWDHIKDIVEDKQEWVQAVQEIDRSMDGQGLRLARVGLLGAQVAELWNRCGIPSDKLTESMTNVSTKITEGLRELWEEAAKVLRETDEEQRPRCARPRETMWNDAEEVLMAQAKAGVQGWEETEHRLHNTTCKKRQQWVKEYREQRNNGSSPQMAADKAAEWLRGERDRGGQAAGAAQSRLRQDQSSADESGDQSNQSDSSAGYQYLPKVQRADFRDQAWANNQVRQALDDAREEREERRKKKQEKQRRLQASRKMRMEQQAQLPGKKSRRIKRKVSLPSPDPADSDAGGTGCVKAAPRRSKARIESEGESENEPQLTPTQLSQQEQQEQDVDTGAAMGEGGEGQQSDLLTSSSSSSDEAVWVHREHHAPIKKQQRFRASARQGGSRARKYTQGDVQEQQKAGEQGGSTAEQDSDKATNDESGRRDAGTHAIHLRHGQHPSMND